MHDKPQKDPAHDYAPSGAVAGAASLRKSLMAQGRSAARSCMTLTEVATLITISLSSTIISLSKSSNLHSTYRK